MKRLLGLTLAATCAFYTFVPAEGNDRSKKKPRATSIFEVFCSDVSCLIASMNEANTRGGASTINLDPGTYTLTSVDNVAQRPNGLPVVTSELTINGVDAATTIIERDPGAPVFRIFDVAAAGSLTLNGLTIRGGRAQPFGAGINNNGILNVSYSVIESNEGISSSGGGGISNGPTGTLTITYTILAANRAFEGGGIYNLGTAVVVNSTITGNGAAGGGGVTNHGTMTIENSTVNDNRADFGGGISNSGVMEIKNTTIADNLSFGFAGAGVSNSGTLKITNSTISGNVATAGSGGGIATSGVLELQNTIVALNSGDPRLGGPDCSGPITSLGNNIIGDVTRCGIGLAVGDLVTDPGLGAFVDDETPGGGHFPLLVSSPAIDRGNDDVCSADPDLSTDQLGQPRVGPCDIGAVEFEGALTIAIDVRPQRDPNRINPNSTRNINVALLSAPGFDATLIDPNTVRFGATGVEAAPLRTRRRDVNGDGQRDLVLRFQIPELGIECGASSLMLTAQNPAGHPITGSSPIITTGCRQ